MKLWNKTDNLDSEVEKFTTGSDKIMDRKIVRYDIVGTIAHTLMLKKIGVLNTGEATRLISGLRDILRKTEQNGFAFQNDAEDIHSQIEIILTRRFNELGRKIHTGRSRNDQVMVDVRMYYRDEINNLTQNVNRLFKLLIALSEKHKNDLMPGYTHMQIAMPSSFGLWFGAFAESLVNDLNILLSAYRNVNHNPLGSAAGYGSSIHLDRRLTTKLLGFYDLNYNSIYAQMSRGKVVKTLSCSISGLAETISHLAMDICLYSGQNYGFFILDEKLATGSSIMPHKRNPDIFELIRGNCNRLQLLPTETSMLITNLPTGYHRDFQIFKEMIFSGFDSLNKCIEMMILGIKHIRIRKNLLEEDEYNSLFSVEEVNRLVKKGMSFRDAYHKVKKEMDKGNHNPVREIRHTHEGSIGNLCNDEIEKKMKKIIRQFQFNKATEAVNKLLEEDIDKLVKIE